MVLMEKYPLSYKKCREWLENELPAAKDKADMILEMTLTYNPWILFSFFDKEGIYISMDIFTTKEGADFNPMVTIGKRTEFAGEPENSRTKALINSINKAFEILNDKLKSE